MKPLIRFSALALTALLILAGCGNPQTVSQPAAETTQATEAAAPDRSLNLSVEQDSQSSQSFSSEELGGNYAYRMDYRWIKSVSITLDGETLPLETALAQGNITEDEILYRARQDARAQVCETEANSLRGLTNYYFHYPEYSLLIIQDVYETPDGAQHPISYLTIYSRCAEGSNDVVHYVGPYASFTNPETGVPIDREDWGLDFEVSQAAPDGVSLICTQSGGQQIGSLCVEYFYLSDDSDSLKEIEDAQYQQIPIPMNGSSTLHIDWTKSFGVLPAGNYQMSLVVSDQFEPEQAHPLMVDFHDQQLYSVSFTIAE